MKRKLNVNESADPRLVRRARSWVTRLAGLLVSLAAVGSMLHSTPAQADLVDPTPGGYNWTVVASKRVYPWPTNTWAYCNLKIKQTQADSDTVRTKAVVSCNHNVAAMLLEQWSERGSWQDYKQHQCQYSSGGSNCNYARNIHDPSGSQEFRIAIKVRIWNPTYSGYTDVNLNARFNS